jgi:CRISPR-associated protein Cst2
LSPVYVGWAKGYLDEEREKLAAFAATPAGQALQVSHPREAYRALIAGLKANPAWLD